MSDQPPRVLSGLEIPEDLRAIPDPCLRLFVRGTLPKDGTPRVAVVGSRTPSWSGRRTAHAIAFGLARAGVVVVSGLARGIDAAAHEGALDAGGVTLAFLGAGVDVLYPRSSRRLAERIPDRGALISEYEPGSPPLPYHFVLRNRLVAAYTKGVLVVEAGPQSGALITAGKALELGREVWAVPGDPERSTTKGSNRLLRDGAGCVLDAEDLLVALGLSSPGGEPGEEPIPPGLTESEERAWRAIRDLGTANVEYLARATGLPVAALLEALSLLELTGHVSRDGSAFSLCRRR